MAKIQYDFDILDDLGIEIKKENKEDALEQASELLKTLMLEYIGEAKSPLSNGLWKPGLSKKYKKIKGDLSSSNIANLELSGDLLDSLSVHPVGGKIRIEIPSDQAGKAEGNLIGSYGREPDPKKAREFMPHDEFTSTTEFKRPIISKLKALLEEFE